MLEMMTTPDNNNDADQERRRQFAEDVLSKTFAESRRKEAERHQAIEDAILANPDKEPFSVDSLREYYSLRDTGGEEQISPEVIEDYKASYYLKNPEVKNIEDFAEILRWYDSHEAN